MVVLDALDEQTDLRPLAELLADPQIEVVVHAGRQDVALLRRCAADRGDADLRHPDRRRLRRPARPRPATTRCCARCSASACRRPPATRAGTAARSTPSSSPTRARTCCTCSSSPPSSSGACATASRLGWAIEECRYLETRDRRPRRRHRLRAAAARQLAEPERARDRARAGRAGASRSPSARTGRSRPCSTTPRWSSWQSGRRAAPRQLEGVRGVNPGSLRRRGDDLLAAIARGAARPPIPVEAERREPSTPLDGPQIALAEALVRARALEAGLAYELIAARADLAAIVCCARSGQPEPDVRTLAGWRREVVGERAARAASRRTRDRDRPRRPPGHHAAHPRHITMWRRRGLQAAHVRI